MADDDKILVVLDPVTKPMPLHLLCMPLVDELTAIIALRAGNIPITQWPANLIVLELRCLKAVRFVRAEAPSVTDDEEN